MYETLQAAIDKKPQYAKAQADSVKALEATLKKQAPPKEPATKY